MLLTLATLSCVIWLYLLAGRGQFWRCAERLGENREALAGPWPSVAAIVPARDELEVIGSTLPSLLAQAYPGDLTVILVDDHSSDGTARAARSIAAGLGLASRVTVLSAPALPHGWTGKLWALSHGIAHARAQAQQPDFLWLTDADVAYAEHALLDLVSKARADRLILTSVMAKLRCESLVERALIPAFVFFFQMLYPFGWVNDRARSVAAAAGGCMLVRREALETAGGVQAIRGELIDDCALARRLQPQGPIWLGFSDRVRSVRACSDVQDARRMIARTAYCQLRYSAVLLALTLVGLSLTYFVPVAAAMAAHGWAQAAGIAAWGLMILAFQPTLRLYRLSPAWGIVLPAIAFAYFCFTLDSAIQHGRARGGLWKGRTQAAQSQRG